MAISSISGTSAPLPQAPPASPAPASTSSSSSATPSAVVSFSQAAVQKAASDPDHDGK